MPTNDAYFMNKAFETASLSIDRSRKVGCVIVSPDNKIVSRGFNSFPRGIDDQIEERHERPEKYLWTEHAERNAIYAAASEGIRLKGCRAYVNWFPCMECGRGLFQVGIKELVAIEPDFTDPRWGDDFRKVMTLLSETNITVRFVDGTSFIAHNEQKQPSLMRQHIAPL